MEGVSKTITIVPNGDLTLVLKPTKHHHPFLSQLPHCSESQKQNGHGHGQIRFIVTAAHLSFLSPPIRIFLRPNSPAGAILDATGRTSLDFQDDDPEAMSLILHHIYGRNRFTPRKIALAVLAQVCKLIDFYMLQEAMQPMCSLWYEALEWETNDLGVYRPQQGLETLIYWITVAHVLGKRQDLDELLLEGVVKYYGQFAHDIDYPMPDAMIAAVVERRAEYFDKVATLLYELKDDCEHKDVSTVHGCTHLLLEIVQNMFSDLSTLSMQASDALIDALEDLDSIASARLRLETSHALSLAARH